MNKLQFYKLLHPSPYAFLEVVSSCKCLPLISPSWYPHWLGRDQWGTILCMGLYLANVGTRTHAALTRLYYTATGSAVHWAALTKHHWSTLNGHDTVLELYELCDAGVGPLPGRGEATDEPLLAQAWGYYSFTLLKPTLKIKF